MDYEKFATQLEELFTWYASLTGEVREEDRTNAVWVNELLTANRRIFGVHLLRGDNRGLRRQLLEMRSVLTRPGTGAILNLNRYPVLLTTAGTWFDWVTEKAGEVPQVNEATAPPAMLLAGQHLLRGYELTDEAVQIILRDPMLENHTYLVGNTAGNHVAILPDEAGGYQVFKTDPENARQYIEIYDRRADALAVFVHRLRTFKV